MADAPAFSTDPSAPAVPIQPWGEATFVPEGVEAILDSVQCSGVTAIWWHCRPHWSIPPRLIPDEMLFAVLRGHGSLQLPGRTVELRPGVCAHIRRGEQHAVSHDVNNPLEVIAIHYQAVVGGVTVAQLLDFPDAFAVPPDSPAAATLAAACREWGLREAGWRPRLTAMMTDLFIGLVRAGANGWLRQPAYLHDAQRLLPAVAAMRAHVARPLTMTALAKKCGLSVAHFRRVFHQVFACAPLEYLHQIRIAEAAHLLRDEGLSVQEVARRVGYTDAAWFSHTFRRLTGVRPGVFAQTRSP